MTLTGVQLAEIGPDDDLFPAWCEVLGALVKTAVLRELATTLPAVRRISTYDSDANTPMVAVNEALGFWSAGQLPTWSLRM